MSDSLAPGFLIAVPYLQDPNFRKAVVLLLELNADGAMGIVINQKSPLRLGDLCADHQMAYRGTPEKCVFNGGPVQPEQGLVLYGDEHRDPEGRQVLDGLHVSASRATLGRLCEQERARFHCYSGYAGWGPGQLEREIAEGSWIVTPCDAGTVLDAPAAEVWSRCLTANGIDPGALVPGGCREA